MRKLSEAATTGAGMGWGVSSRSCWVKAEKVEGEGHGGGVSSRERKVNAAVQSRAPRRAAAIWESGLWGRWRVVKMSKEQELSGVRGQPWEVRVFRV